MRLRLCFLGVLTCVAAGCGASRTATTTVRTATTTVATTATTTTAPASMALTVFRVDNGLLRPTVTRVPRTTAVAGAALAALGIDAPVSIADGTATVALDRATQDEQAEIVYTLTQFPTVARVDVAGRHRLTRDAFASYVPPILIDAPAAGAEVPSTFRVSGSASVFEATLVVELVRDGKVIETRTVTASEGAPGRGSFAVTLRATPGDATISAFAPSAADGSPQHRVDVAVTVVS